VGRERKIYFVKKDECDPSRASTALDKPEKNSADARIMQRTVRQTDSQSTPTPGPRTLSHGV
jgi:hypothetical protein